MTKKKPPFGNLKNLLGNVTNSISGGADVDLNDLDGPPPVTDETEQAYKKAQRKKAEESNDGNDGYG